MVRIGLVIVALALVSLVLLGLGVGLGFVEINSHGVALVHKDDADATNGDQQRVVSADDLLRQKHIDYSEPAATAPSASPVAPAPATPVVAQKPAPSPASSTPPATVVSKPPAKATPPVSAVPIQAALHEPGDKQVVIRINAGSHTAVRDRNGNVWEAESGFEGDKIVDRGPIAIANTDFPDIYRTEHYEMTAWNKAVPNGKYTVNLHFAETCDHINDAKHRIFNVSVQRNELKDLDVAKEAGGMCKALVKTFHVDVTDGKLSILFKHGPTDDGPEINGIEVIAEPFAIRIDAGSPTPVRDPRGNTWEAESGFDGGKTVDRGSVLIANTDFPDIYRTEHYDMTSWTKSLPNGKYTVNLHFAETWQGINDSHPRIFHVNVQGNELHDFNVMKEAGGLRRALVKSFHVTVSDGKLVVLFQKTKDDAPEINGIEVIAER